MTKDEILSMAREAEHLLINEYYTNGTVMGFSFPQLERFAALVAEKEREACAKVCEQVHEDFGGPDEWDWHSKDYARAIRARGN
jgi:hypothetical protein